MDFHDSSKPIDSKYQDSLLAVNVLEPKTSINIPFPSGRCLLGIKIDISFFYLKHLDQEIIITQFHSVFHHAPYFDLCTLELVGSSHERDSGSA